MLAKSYGIQVDFSNRFRIAHERILRKARKREREAISPQRFGLLRPILVGLITTIPWDYLQCFGAVPPSGQEI